MNLKNLFIALLMPLALMFCSTDVTKSDEGSVFVKPQISFRDGDSPAGSLDSVSLLVIMVSFQNTTIRDTFDFKDHAGSLSSPIPTNTPFKLYIQGIDRHGKVIYYGEHLFSGAASDTTVAIAANMVTPFSPGNLIVSSIGASAVQLTWKDESSNEAGFIIKRSEKDTLSFIVIDTIAPNTDETVDSGGITPLTIYYYKLTAYNASGESAALVKKFDPLEVVPAPVKPAGETALFADSAYFFWTDTVVCGNNHPAQYRFCWGDTDTSKWLDSPIDFHSWKNSGTYLIKAQARCSVNHDVLSAWSEELTVIVSGRKP